MFLTTALKDYVDQLNDLSLSLNDNLTLFNVLKCGLLYFLDSIKIFFIYILSFQWLTDFIELPCNFKANYIAILGGENVFQTILETKIGPNFFAFTNAKIINQNHFGTGLLNSFFLALPLSVAHFLTIRAFLLNGIPAAIYAAAGTILGQFCFLTCVLFGFEAILIPFFNLEPLNYIIGLIITVNLLYTMTHKPLVLPIKQTQKNLLLPFFGMNFFLAWTEQTSVFQYFGNLTVNSFPTLLQNNFETIISNSFYLIGLLVGVIGWTFIFGAVVMQIRNWVAGVFLIPFAYLNNKIHYATLFITFVFCLTSVPYYGFDYLVSNPLGFVSQDKSLMWAKSKPSFEIKGFGKDTEQKYPPLFLNMSPFDQNALLTEDSIHFYEDFSFPPVQYWNNRSYVRPATISKTVRKNTASTSSQQKSEFDIRTANALNKIYKTDTQLETKSFKPSGSLDLEVNVDTIAQQIFDEDRTAYDYFTKPGDDIVTKTQFWDKYKSNPVYKVLTQFEINSFLLGQPSYQNLNADDEVELYKRRVIFERYLDSIEQYKVTQQPKKSTFAEKVYNQQFKGTFDIVRQFFPIEVTDAQFGGSLLPLLSENQKQEVFEKTQSVLKYDQPLYNEVVRDFNPLFHEELSNPFAQSGSKKLAVIDSIPFYIGWDGSLRKFLVKTNCIPGFPNGTSITSVNYKLNNESNKSPLKLPLYFSFQSWPKTEASFVPGSNALIPYHPISNETKEIIANYYSLDDSTPDEKRGESNSNKALENVNLPVYNWSQVTRAPSFKKVEGAILNSTLPRQRGGLTWPGVGEEK